MQNIGDLLDRVRKSTSEEELFKFYRENLPGVSIELARHPYATPRILESLTRDTSIIVRHEVAKNPKTAIETLERLAQDKDMLVRDYARRNLVSRTTP